LPKKTLATIIDSNNDYIIAVKKNQKKLYELLENKSLINEPVSLDISQEISLGRDVKRTVKVYDDLSCLNLDYWKGTKSLICVTREGRRGSKPYYQKVFYISSLSLTASEFGKRIREHWSIENQLHWVKDVVFQEDISRIHCPNAQQNFSIIRTIIINLIRAHGVKSCTELKRNLKDNIVSLWLFLQLEI
jgi:predicted transposase YbfD/YdcC